MISLPINTVANCESFLPEELEITINQSASRLRYLHELWTGGYTCGVEPLHLYQCVSRGDIDFVYYAESALLSASRKEQYFSSYASGEIVRMCADFARFSSCTECDLVLWAINIRRSIRILSWGHEKWSDRATETRDEEHSGFCYNRICTLRVFFDRLVTMLLRSLSARTSENAREYLAPNL